MYYECTQHNLEISWGIEGKAEYLSFGRMVDMDERVRKMKGYRICLNHVHIEHHLLLTEED